MKRLAALLIPTVIVLALCGAATPPNVGYVQLEEDVSVHSAQLLMKSIEAANRLHMKALVIDIDSGGGDVDEGFKVVKAIERSAVPIICVADHRAESMAFAILQACPVRVMTTRTVLMTHQVRIVSLPDVRENGARNALDNLVATDNAFAVHASHRLKISLAEYKAHVDSDREWWIGWEEAMNVGAVDMVTDSVRDVLAKTREGSLGKPTR